MGKQRDDVLKELRHKIVNGDYPPGDWFSEADVAAQLGDNMSRTPIREAFAVLVQEGLLEQVARRGVKVRHIGPPEAREILRLRRALELEVVAELAASTRPDRLSGLAELLDEMQEAALNGDVKGFLDRDSEFHCRLAMNAGFDVAADMLRALRSKVRLMGLDAVEQHSSLVHRNLVHANDMHHAIVGAIAKGEVKTSLTLLEQHLDLTSRRLLGEVTEGLPARVKEIGELVQKARDMRHRGHRPKAVLAVLEQALAKTSVSEELHHERMQALVELSATLRAAGDYKEAEKHALEALRLSELYKNRTGIAWANYELGRIALDDQESDRPHDVRRLEEALAISDEERLSAWVHYSLALKGRMGDREGSWRHAQAALDTFSRSNDRWGVAQCLNLLGQLSANQGREDEAGKYFEKATTIADREDFPRVRANAALNKSTLTPRALSAEAARAELEQALDLYASMDDVAGVRRVRHGLRQLASRPSAS